MNIKKHIRNEYKSWLLAIFFILVMMLFGKSFEYVKSIAELNSIFKIGSIMLIFTLGFSFMFYSIYANELEYNIELEFREYENEDVKKIQRKLKKMLIIFSVSSIIWIIGILIIGIEYGNTENLKYFTAIIVTPIMINGIMIYLMNRIKTAYNNVQN